MLKIALSQLRTHPRRYVSVVLAILIGTLFLAASFVVSSSAQATLRASLGATYANADLVAVPGGTADSQQDSPDVALSRLTGTAAKPGELAKVDGVAEAYAAETDYVQVSDTPKTDDSGSAALDGGEFSALSPLPEQADLAGMTLAEGRTPEAGTRQVVVDTTTADRLGLTLGSEFSLESGGPESQSVQVTVVGLAEPSADPRLSALPQTWGPQSLVEEVRQTDAEGTSPDPSASAVLFRLDDGADAGAVQQRLQSLLDGQKVDATVSTPDEAVRAQLADSSGGTDVFAWVLGGFAALALLVTALVIANTFQVLVAQRTRELALLRTLGASTRQVRLSVLLEGLLVGLIGSVLGTLLGVGLAAVAIPLLRGPLNLSTLTFGADPVRLLIAAGVGVLVAVLASLTPAFAATRVSPLQALQPVPEVTVRSRGGAVRTVLGAVLFFGGTALMLWGAFGQSPVPAIGGGMLSFIGMLMLATVFVPPAVSAAGLLARPAGVPGRLAAVNAVRHRSRTASTAAALLIGTTLVTLFLVGGRTAQVSTDAALDTEYPVDLSVTLAADADAEAVAKRVGDLADVQAVTVATPVGTTENGSPAYAVDADGLRQVISGLPGDGMSRLGDEGTVLAPSWVEDDVTVTVAGKEATLHPVGANSLESEVYMTDTEAKALGWDGKAVTGEASDGGEATTAPRLLVATADDVPVTGLQDLTQEVARAADVDPGSVTGGAPMRALYAQIIDTMLWIVVALLAVSVVIALIGVANTLSLSAIERTRENSLLRALGLTKGGLRTMIALEAVLIAAVAAALGCALGVLYGWAGSQLLLGELMDSLGRGSVVTPAVPWLELLLIVGVAALAGLLASVMPSRRATRMSPVEGLASV
ncbi:ABC transporter permease [Micrococcus lylae]|uniref:ABC transporter permease n=1 Tax=Micrococcus lylae TaxID=1273 RepID=UPI003EB8CF58